MTSRRYLVGERVRVNRGITHADYPDVSLDGWVGMVIEVHGYDTYTVRWSDQTLARIDPLVRDRCERDGVDLETYWITGDELDPDSPVVLEIESSARLTDPPTGINGVARGRQHRPLPRK
jgi:hypothetical protein